jgi:hypothetical protein
MRGKGKLWKYSGFRWKNQEIPERINESSGLVAADQGESWHKNNLLCFSIRDPLRLSLPIAADLSSTIKESLCV